MMFQPTNNTQADASPRATTTTTTLASDTSHQSSHRTAPSVPHHAFPTTMAAPVRASKTHKLYNLILPICVSTRRVLLGHKKRGFGVGKYNGFGGKVEAGETLVGSAVRELHEESGLLCAEADMRHIAVLLLETVAPGADTEKLLEIHLFVCTRWSGEIEELAPPPPPGGPRRCTESGSADDGGNRSDEMRPSWFEPADLPLDHMWEETRIWMATVLGLYLPSPPAPRLPAKDEARDEAKDKDTDTDKDEDEDEDENNNKRWFIHYVDFHGAVNAQTGQWDPWHGMGTSVWQWFDAPLVDWTRERVVAWADAIRSGGEARRVES